MCQGAISFHQELLQQMDKDLGQLTKEQEPGDTSTVGMLQMLKKVVLTVDLL
jgi:succinate dehydrogenase flavin-adding protein (antitoxin of CptAB toxin-antitoxin module)